MNDRLLVKRNISSFHVLKTLKILLEGDFTMSEIVDKLNQYENDVIFNNSVVSKYINTCRFCNIEIINYKNRYYLCNLPFGYKFSEEELFLLNKLQDIAKENLSGLSYDIFANLIKKINRFSSQYIVNMAQNNKSEFKDIFNQAIYEKRKINIIFKDNESSEYIPVSVLENQKNIFLNVINNDNSEELINLQKIKKIEFSNKKFNQKFTEKSVIFKLKNNLAKRYTLRENETLLESSSDEIIIANRFENKEILLSRLLRYDENCEIISPKEYRTEMLNILVNTLKNYEDLK